MFTGDAILNINDIIKNAQKIKAPQKSIIGVEGAVHDLALSKKKAREIAYKLLFDWLNANII